jgi:excinuclease ABC subunit C
MASENAAETLSMLRARWEADRSKHVEAIAQLQESLALNEVPNRIEGYDISNLQGTAAAGSMVVFERGVPRKSAYRKFTIKSVEGQDDFDSMEEVLTRRFKRWELATEEAKKPGAKLDQGFGLLPDLVLIDGGKGQLSRAISVLEDHGLQGRVNAAGLAKNHEEMYLPGQKDPVILPRRSQALFLVQRIRDEAHRFALRHHQTQRRKKGLAAQLDQIAGIGPAKRNALLKAFGNLQAIRAAKPEQLAQVPGISLKLAQRLKAELI